jgi:hypothetical protein
MYGGRNRQRGSCHGSDESAVRRVQAIIIIESDSDQPTS